MWITELINNIPELVGVIAPGFLFVNSFMNLFIYESI